MVLTMSNQQVGEYSLQVRDTPHQFSINIFLPYHFFWARDKDSASAGNNNRINLVPVVNLPKFSTKRRQIFAITRALESSHDPVVFHSIHNLVSIVSSFE
jgi:hypothetical protein